MEGWTMAATERNEGSTLKCDSCHILIPKGSTYVLVGEQEKPWCNECAEDLGVPIDDDGEDDDDDC
jgi:hypothetical protein